MTLEEIYDHLFKRDYWSMAERDQNRIKKHSEFFTPKSLVDEMLDKLEEAEYTVFSDSKRTFLDPACGDGNFLANVLYRKIESGIDIETALGTIYGVDIKEDNVEICRQRLSLGNESLYHICEYNIRCADFLNIEVKDIWNM